MSRLAATARRNVGGLALLALGVLFLISFAAGYLTTG